MPRKPRKPEDSATEPRPPRLISFTKDPAYWQALGEFIELFASAEHVLFNYLSLYVNIHPQLAKALFSGFHVDQMISLIRRVWIVTPPDDMRDKLDDALSQFKAINDVRNSMVHNVSYVTSDKGRLSSNTRAMTVEHVKEFRVEPDILKDIIADTEKIRDHLIYTVMIIADPRNSPNQLIGDFPTLPASWRYKWLEDQKPSAPKQKLKGRI